MDPRPPSSNPFEGIDADLASLDELSVRDQVPVFTRIHSRLTNALATTASSGDGQFGNPAPGQQPPAHQRSGHLPQPGRR